MLAWIKKHKIIFIVEMLCLVLLLPGCFAKEKVLVEDRQMSGTGVHRIENITLKPGVYRLEAHDAVLEDAFVTFYLHSATATYKAIRYNAINVTNQVPAAECMIYVADSVEDAYIECAPAGISNNCVTVALVRLNTGSRIALFYVALASLVLNLLIRLREKILSGKIPVEKQLAGGIVALAVGMAYLPYATDYFSFEGELLAHLTEIERLSENGLSEIGGSLYLLPAVLLRMVGLPLMNAYKLYLLVLLVAAAVLTCSVFGHCTGNWLAAAFGSVAYVTCPYFINVLYGVQAPSVIAAMAVCPGVLGGVYCLMRKTQGAKGFRWGSFLWTCAGVVWLVLNWRGRSFGEIVSGVAVGMYACGAVALAAWLLNGKSKHVNSGVARGILLLLFLIAFTAAAYRTNEIALHNHVVRLYDM